MSRISIYSRRTPVKISAFAIAAAAVIGLASLSAPASASSVQTKVIQTNAAAPITDFSAARYVKRTVIRRGPVCSMRTVVRRGAYGRRVVTKTRVCR
jgi:hypothetical protein